MNYQTLLESLNNSHDCRKETCLYNFSNRKTYEHSKSSAVKFMKNYCDMIIHSDQRPMLGEMIGDTMPLIGEFVFKFKNTELDETKPYNEELIAMLVTEYQTMIDYFFEVSTSTAEKLCYVCESSKWDEGAFSFYKIKLQFPFCVTTKEFVRNDFRKKNVG